MPRYRKHKRVACPLQPPDTTAPVPTFLQRLPTEIYMMILSYLKPSDLLALGHVSSAMRTELLSPGYKQAWKYARLRYEDAPAPPPGMTELVHAWRYLRPRLTCSVCGKKAQLILHLIGVRACLKHVDHLTIEWDVIFNNIVRPILGNVVLYVAHDVYVDGVRKTVYLANKASVENLEQKISMFDQDDPDVLSPELERWAEIKGRERDEKLEHTNQMNAWRERVQDANTAKKTALSDEHESSVLKRLREEGYDPDDLTANDDLSVEFQRLLRVPTIMTEKHWARVGHSFYQIVDERQLRRQCAELVEAVSAARTA